MKRIVTTAMFSLLLTLVFSTPNATANEPLFLTESKKALSLTIDGNAITIRGERAGFEGTIKCGLHEASGFILDKSSLVRELNIVLSGGCEQEVLGSKGSCEFVKLVRSYGELGLLNGHIYLLFAPEEGTTFVTFGCTNGNTTVSGAVIGEFSLNGRNGSSQYGVDRKEFLLLYKGKGTTQEPEEIELLGVKMTGVSIKLEGFFGGKGSLESTQLLLVDGNALIDP